MSFVARTAIIALAIGCTSATDRAPVAESTPPARHDSLAPVVAPAITPAIAPVAAATNGGPTEVHAGPIPDVVRIGCDSAAAMVHDALAIAATRADGSYADSFQGTTRVGCRVSGDGSFKALNNRDPVGVLAEAFAQRGWYPDVRFVADGPDGSVVAVRRRDMLCIVSGSWDGGDDSEPATVAPKPEEDHRYGIIVECAEDVLSNAAAGVPDSLWSVARRAGLDSIYAISPRLTSRPYFTGDFDGDGVVDAAVLVEHRVSGKLGIAVVRRGAGLVNVLAAGSRGPGPDDLDGLIGLEPFRKDVTIDLTIGDRPHNRLLADALWVKRESAAGFYLWAGNGFIYEPHDR